MSCQTTIVWWVCELRANRAYAVGASQWSEDGHLLWHNQKTTPKASHEKLPSPAVQSRRNEANDAEYGTSRSNHLNQVLRGMIVGGVVGGAIAALQATRRPASATAGTSPDAVPAIARGVAEGALAGTVVGFLLDRRARSAAGAFADDGVARGRQFAEKARPVLESAYGSVSEQLHEVGDTVATSLVPSVVAAAERAVGVLGDAAEAARPVVESAVDSTRSRAASLAA